MNPRRLCQGLQDITGYKMKACKITGTNAPLPHELNPFYACFEQEVTRAHPPPRKHQTNRYSRSTLQMSEQLSRRSTHGKGLARMRYLDKHSDPARISWREYSQTSSTSLYKNLRSPSASRRRPSSQCLRKTKQRALMTISRWL